jgi:cytochrome b6-f complex iron-sulfur subunit/menaquinol-cytochrome c reductase iron-sulfur subunit
LVVLGSAAYAGALVVPGVGFVAGEAKKGARGERWMRVAELSALPEGAPTRVKVMGELRDAFTVSANVTLGSVWLMRSGDSVRALSAECPHLGCAIDLNGDATSFGCPCHSSKFSLAGASESGPSPRAMDELSARVADGHVEIDFRRFRQGIGDKVEVG